MSLILASSSPRRKDLLLSINIIPDQIISPDVDETPLQGEAAPEYVQRVASAKAHSVSTQCPNTYVIAADTILTRGRKIILKPEDEADARHILQEHSGRRHRALTAVCVISPEGREAARVVETRLSFKRVTLEEINDYIETKEWEGKAGAYDIRGYAAKFIKFLSGSYTNVIGLPLYETECLLKGLGFSNK